MVRPWKAPSVATTWVRPVLRVSLNAASLASAPELAKKTLPRVVAAERESSRQSARRGATCGSVAKKFETWPSVCSWAVTASTSAGWAWPREFTAMPPSRSRYCLPASSQTYAPSPRVSTSLGGPKVFISASA